jgi:uncharacterized protein YfiM (DUF2279 family)
MKPFITLLIIGANFFGLAQLQTYDTFVSKRFAVTNLVIGSTWTASVFGLQNAWYKNSQSNNFHFIDDASNWMQMDKAGHFYTTAKLSLLTSDCYKWAGINPKKAAIAGSLIGLGYQTTLEIFDGYSTDWGFSWSDMTANVLGAGFFLAQDLLWNEQRFIPKFSYHPTEYAAYRPSVLGSNFQERLLKDYNGQTYWISFSPAHIQRFQSLPKWLCVSFGYSVDQKLVGDQDNYLGFQAQREWLFSLDVDFSQLKTKKKWVNILLKQLNYIKIPFPTLSLKNGKIYGYGIYF